MEDVPDSLTAMILDWQISGNGYYKIIDECTIVIFDYAKRFLKWDHDLCADFFIFFYPRLIKLIKQYQFNGRSFHAILNNTISWQIKTFYKRKNTKEKKEKCIENYSEVEYKNYTYECSKNDISFTKEAAEIFRVDTNGKIIKKKLALKLLFLVLKNALLVEEDDLDQISNIIGCERDWLLKSVRKLKSKCEDRTNRFVDYNCRANKAFMDLWQVQKALYDCCEKKEEIILLEKEKKLRARFESAIRRKNTVHYSPTNEEIAEVIGMPKGTVDSGLFYFRRLLNENLTQEDHKTAQ